MDYMLIFKQRILPLKGQLFFAAYNLIQNEQEVEEILQDSFLKIWQKRESWIEIENMKAYCLKTVRNASIDKLRLKGNNSSLAGLVLDDSPDYYHSPDKKLAQKEMNQMIQKAIERLPEQQRLVFEMREYEDKSYQEIAEWLSLSLEQVKVYLFRARKALQTILKDVRY